VEAASAGGGLGYRVGIASVLMAARRPLPRPLRRADRFRVPGKFGRIALNLRVSATIP